MTVPVEKDDSTSAKTFIGARIFDTGSNQGGIVLLIDEANAGVIFWCDTSDDGMAGIAMANAAQCVVMDEGHASRSHVRQLLRKLSPALPSIE